MNIGTPPITKEEIFSKIGSLEIYQFYMPWKFELNKNCLNPIVAEKNPSFRIYYKGGEAFHKSYNSNHRGSPIDFVMQLFDLTYTEALNKIAKDFGIIEGKAEEIVKLLPKIEKKEKKELILSSQRKEFTEGHKEYLKQYGLNIHDLNCFNDTKVYALDKFWINGKSFPLEKDEIGFIYYIPKTKKQKIYLPFRGKGEKWWSSIPFDFIHGLDNMKGCNTGIISKSIKDGAIIYKYLTKCVCVIQAENASSFSKENIEFFKSIPNLYVGMDSDNPGKAASYQITKLLGAKHINAPDRILNKGGTDFADMAKIEGVNELIKHFKKKKVI